MFLKINNKVVVDTGEEEGFYGGLWDHEDELDELHQFWRQRQSKEKIKTVEYSCYNLFDPPTNFFEGFECEDLTANWTEFAKNPYYDIEGFFSYIKGLRRLDISENRFDFVSAGTLEGCDELETLVCKDMDFYDFKYDFVKNLPKLKVVDLRNNNLNKNQEEIEKKLNAAGIAVIF